MPKLVRSRAVPPTKGCHAGRSTHGYVPAVRDDPDPILPTALRPRLAVLVESDETMAELMADRLFSLGASAVAEHVSEDGVPALVADLDPASFGELVRTGVACRVLEHEAVWHDGWRAHARIWRVGGRLVVRPAWVEAVPLGPAEVEVVVEPGRAFGSGSHPTTRLCLALLESLVSGGERVIDVGSGSGVLGIAAAKLGAAHVRAVDVDPEAVRATKASAALNGVADVVEATEGVPPEDGAHYDLVLANLLLPVFDQHGADLVALLAPGGRLVASGVLEEQQSRLHECLRPLQPESTVSDGDWLAVTFRRR
jgi:ribosomal protein L11 methyltransferase